MILEAPHEVVSSDDLIRGIWGSREPGTPRPTLHVFLHRLRTKFAAADPDFDKLRVRADGGLYWARNPHAMRNIGRVGAAKFVPMGRADDQTIKLTAKEHAILCALLRRELITAPSVAATSQGSFAVTTSTLNRKFRAVLGESLVTPGPRGLRAFSLNGALR